MPYYAFVEEETLIITDRLPEGRSTVAFRAAFLSTLVETLEDWFNLHGRDFLPDFCGQGMVTPLTVELVDKFHKRFQEFNV